MSTASNTSTAALVGCVGAGGALWIFTDYRFFVALAILGIAWALCIDLIKSSDD